MSTNKEISPERGAEQNELFYQINGISRIIHSGPENCANSLGSSTISLYIDTLPHTQKFSNTYTHTHGRTELRNDSAQQPAGGGNGWYLKRTRLVIYEHFPESDVVFRWFRCTVRGDGVLGWVIDLFV